MSKKLWFLVAISLAALVYGVVSILGFNTAMRDRSLILGFFSFALLVVLFHVGIALEDALDDWRGEKNPWVKDVKAMSYWWNPMFFVWLHECDRKRWAKWIVGFAVPSVIFCSHILILLFTVKWEPTFEEYSASLLTASAAFTLWAIRYYMTSIRKIDLE